MGYQHRSVQVTGVVLVPAVEQNDPVHAQEQLLVAKIERAQPGPRQLQRKFHDAVGRAGEYSKIDPTGKGRKRWTMRWKAPLNAFQIAFEGRLTPANN